MTGANVGEVVIAKGKQELAEKAADAIVADLNEAIARQGSANWTIAGGSLPPVAYGMLAETAADRVDWAKVSFVVGDERLAPFASEDSNWGQFKRAFLDKVPQAGGEIAPPPTDVEIEGAEAKADAIARAYEQELVSKLPKTNKGVPRLDVMWVGMGPDGHTLSLFPSHPSSTEPTDRLVAPTYNSPKPPATRITLTFKALTGAQKLVVIAAGEDKANRIKQAFDDPDSLPIGRAVRTVLESGGKVVWMLDEAAASKL
jgi:6-phosphogluconolactonase